MFFLKMHICLIIGSLANTTRNSPSASTYEFHAVSFQSHNGLVTVQFRELDFRECHVFARACDHSISFLAKLFEAHIAAPQRRHGRTRAFTRIGSWTAMLKLFPRENSMDVCGNRRHDSACTRTFRRRETFARTNLRRRYDFDCFNYITTSHYAE